jgi:hypothetical protein
MKTTPFVGRKIQVKLSCFRLAAWRLGHRLFREAVLEDTLFLFPPNFTPRPGGHFRGGVFFLK